MRAVIQLAERQGLDLRVTTLERTLVDVLDRPDLAGGWEEVWGSLETVEFFDLVQVVSHVRLLGNATTAARVGFYLEQHAQVLQVSEAHLRALRRLRPAQPRYMDIDLNYVAAKGREAMLADRPLVEQAVAAVCGREDFTIRRTPADEHAGGKWALIIGASAAGLATAACLRQRGKSFRILERAPHVGASWRAHYDRLHLHTSKGLSGLPGLPLPRDYPKYPSRDQVVAYLEQYASHFSLSPQLSTEVTRVAREGDGWVVESSNGRFSAREVVIATGNTRVPHRPAWPGQESFAGTVLHSSAYKTGAAFKVADALSAPLLRVTVGDLTKLGFRKLPYGPAVQIARDGRIPLLDIGTLALIRGGQLKVRPGVERFTVSGVVFEGGVEEAYDAVVVATGYRPRVGAFLEGAGDALDAEGSPRSSGKEALPGLWFCGFYVAPTGMLREIAREAEAIASGIAGRAAA